MLVMTAMVTIFMGLIKMVITVMAIIAMDTMKMDLMFTDMTKQVLTVLAIIAMDMTTMVTILRATMLRVS